jgi:hypothetical protein
MAAQVSMTVDQMRAYCKARIAALQNALDTNMRDGKLIAEAHIAIEACQAQPVTLQNVGTAVAAIARGLDALLVCQMDQMKLVVTGQEEEKAAAEKQLAALPPEGLILPRHTRQ